MSATARRYEYKSEKTRQRKVDACKKRMSNLSADQRHEFAMRGVAARLAARPSLSMEILGENRKRQRELLRLEVLDVYGAKCKCCGETNNKFLTIDHINGGGNAHKRITHGNICRWLRINDFPDGFQVLCYNCNCAKGIYGQCPHQTTDTGE